MEKTATWISAYLFYPHSANDVIKQFISAFMQSADCKNSIYQHFFIRYNESGPHIRLRLKVNCNQEEAVCRQLENQWLAFVLLPEFNSTGVPQLPVAVNDAIKFLTYVPEFERYGGKSLISAAELQFEGSSDAVIKLLTAYGPRWNKNTELITALKLNIILFLSLQLSSAAMMDVCKIFILEWLPDLYDLSKPASEEESFFLSRFKEQYVRYRNQIVPAVSQFFDDFRNGISKDEALISYQKVNQQVKMKYENTGCDLIKNQGIITSFMHMTHNRLGVVNSDEAYIIYLLYKCLEDITANEQLE